MSDEFDANARSVIKRLDEAHRRLDEVKAERDRLIVTQADAGWRPPDIAGWWTGLYADAGLHPHGVSISNIRTLLKPARMERQLLHRVIQLETENARLKSGDTGA